MKDFIDKVYKPLLVIYAPIFVLYVIFQYGLKIISFNILFLTSISIATSSVLFGIFLAIYYFAKRSELPTSEGVPNILRRGVMIFYILLTLVGFGVSGFLLQEKASNDALSNHECAAKKRIVLLLPCNNNLGSAWEDGVRQILGLTYFFRDHPDYTSEYEFRIIDHSMKREIDASLTETIIEEMEKGTKIFISTMSAVSSPLSTKFPEIVKKAQYHGDDPVLICTVASSPAITTSNENNIFRFYIRSQEEGVLLAEKGLELGFSDVSYIVVDDPYGAGAIKEFSHKWEDKSKSVLGGVKVKSLSDEYTIRRKIEENLRLFNEADVLFVAHYGSGVDKVFRALDELGINTPVLASHTLTIPDWQRPIEDILAKRTSYSCRPVFVSRPPNAFPDVVYEDAISGFMYLTLDRLIHCMNEIDGDLTRFSDEWKKTDYPPIMNLTSVGDGDIAIELQFEQIIVE